MSTFHYDKPATVPELVTRLAEHDGRAVLLAGGTDLLVQIRSRLVQPELVLDLKGAPELRELARGEQGLSVGAAVFLNRLLEEHEATDGYTALTQAIGDLASYQIRNRATLVGNVTNASPCADSVPPLCVMGAQAVIWGPQGRRELAVADLIVGNRQTRLARGEVVTQIVIPPLPAGTWSGFRKRKRVKGHDLALASVALLRDPERQALRLSVGSCSPMPVVEELGDMYDRPDVEEAIRRVQDRINPIHDVRASVEYRRDMVAHMTRQLFAEMAAAAR